jgi:hypothetical protein
MKCANVASVTGDSGHVRTLTVAKARNICVQERMKLAVIALLGFTLGTAFPQSNEVKAQLLPTGVNQDASPRNAAEIIESAYELRLRQFGKYYVGRTGRAEVTLLAKIPYHVNQEYPIDFRLRESPGIKYARVAITKDFAQVEPMRALFPIEFTAEHAGHTKIAGTLKFSVCNNQRCLVEKRDLELDVPIHEVK